MNVTFAFLCIQAGLVILALVFNQPAHTLMPISMAVAVLFLPAIFLAKGKSK